MEKLLQGFLLKLLLDRMCKFPIQNRYPVPKRVYFYEKISTLRKRPRVETRVNRREVRNKDARHLECLMALERSEESQRSSILLADEIVNDSHFWQGLPVH